jgi:hypothetical protein
MSTQIHEIALAHLQAHPHNANVMAKRTFATLKDHLTRTDQYPPIIVRPLPDGAGGDDAGGEARPARYQILDGHHRAEALSALGYTTARCVIWSVDDEQALTLLATLNRLEGRDDPHRRAALVKALSARQDLSQLAKQLPEPAAQLKRMTQADEKPPRPTPAPAEGSLPEAMHFFFTPATRRAVEKRLRAFDGNREQALLKALSLAQ